MSVTHFRVNASVAVGRRVLAYTLPEDAVEWADQLVDLETKQAVVREPGQWRGIRLT